MTDWERVRDEAAISWCAEYQYSSHLDRGHAFKAGYDYAIANDPRVMELKLALKEIQDACPDGNPKWMNARASKALKAFEGSGE